MSITTANPLLDFAALPAFDAISADHVTPALTALLADAEAALEYAVGAQVAADYDALSAALDVAVERLSQAWHQVGHLEAVASTPSMRAAYNDNLGRITEFNTRLGADERLYAKYKAIAASPAARLLSPPRQRALINALRDFVLSGAELRGADKTGFAALQEKLAALSQAFSEHVLDATDAFELLVDAERLAGVPDDVVDACRTAAAQQDQVGCKLTLHLPCWLPVMQYATDRDLREALYRAYVIRASEFGPAALDNLTTMVALLDARRQEAALLGYANYAELSLVPKMAASPAMVSEFLLDLARRAKPFAQADAEALRAHAALCGLPELAAWDQHWVTEKLRQARYDFSETEVRPYFPLPRVLTGLFGILENLLDIRITPDAAPVWHDSVRFFRIERATTAGGAAVLIGQFYLDLYARPGKRSGAWLSPVRGRWARPDGTLQTPLAHIVCNFAAPVGDRPALLRHDDVITLFHEFGHGVHHLLTRIDDRGVAGIEGVEWDAVELPSQFMENYCWEWQALTRLSGHVDTGAPLPRELFDRMLAARNFHSGLQLMRQIEFALFDLRLHVEPEAAQAIATLLAEVRAEVSVLPPPPFSRTQNQFSHIFAGGYAAGYYSYLWAEVLSADAWSAFEDAGIFDAECGRRWRCEVLEVGASRSAAANFVAFRGREPKIDALLRHQGLSTAVAGSTPLEQHPVVS
jgi:oligopeptidase A